MRVSQVVSLALLISISITGFGQIGGTIWGTTLWGGEYDNGTIYKFDPIASTLTVIYSFGAEDGLHGIKPFASLFQASNGKIYGATTEGGLAGHGVLFELDPVSLTYSKKLDFYSSDGSEARGTLIEVNGKLYGTTRIGGVGTSGVIYEYVLSTGQFNQLFNFNDESGRSAMGKLVYYNGKLLGTAAAGGEVDRGTLFEFDLSSKTLTKLFDFGGLKGVGPYGSLTETEPGIFYGMTSEGGTNNAGVIFKYDAHEKVVEKKVDLALLTGSSPFGDFLKGENGILYGLTNLGGANNAGTIFQYDINQNLITKVVDLTLENGSNPYGNLVKAANGKFYGTAAEGGLNNKGVVFEFDPATSIYSKKIEFNGANGNFPTFGSPLVYRDQQQIQFPEFEPRIFGDDPFLLSATSSSGLQLEYASLNQDVATVSENKLTILAAGSVEIVASQQGNVAYFPAESITRTLVINKANQTISFSELENRTFGDGSFILSATSNSNLPVTFTSGNNNIISIEGNTVSIVGAGSTTITASQGGNSNYNAASLERSLTVNKADQVVEFDPLSSKTFGDPSFTLSASSSSQLPVSFQSSNEQVAAISGNNVTIVGAGSSLITAVQPGNHNYNAAQLSHTLTVNKANQEITFQELAQVKFGSSPFALTATANSQLQVSYVSSNTSVATITGSTVTLVGVGETTITASQNGNNNFNAAASVERQLTVLKGDQTISFEPLQNRALGSAPFALTATASSSLDVTYSTSSTKVSIVNKTVTLLEVGRVTITANQPGNANYNAAASVDQSFCINPAKPVITAQQSDDFLMLSSSSNSGNQWYKNEIAISGEVQKNLLVTQPGLYTVRVTLAECTSEFSNVFSVIVTSSYKELAESWSLFPNPVDRFVQINIPEAGFKQIQIVGIDGKNVSLFSTMENTFELDANTFPAGVYHVTILTDKRKLTKKIIKR